MLYQLSKPIETIESSSWSMPTSATSTTSASSGTSDLTDLEGWSSGTASDRERHQGTDGQRRLPRRRSRRHRQPPHPPTSDESVRSTEEEDLSTPPTSTGSQPGAPKTRSTDVKVSDPSNVPVEVSRMEVATKSLTTVVEIPENPIEEMTENASPAVVENKNDPKKEVIGITSPKMEAKVNTKEGRRKSTVKKSSAKPVVEGMKSGKNKCQEKKLDKRSPEKIIKRRRTPRTKEEKLADLDAQSQKADKGTHSLYIQRTAAAKIIFESKSEQNERQLSYSMQSYKDLDGMAIRAGRQWYEAKQLEHRQTLVEQVKSMLRKLEGDWQTEMLKDAGGEFHTSSQADYRQVRRQNREYGRVAVSQIRKVTEYDIGVRTRKRGLEEDEEERGDGRGVRREKRRGDIRRTKTMEVIGCSPMEAEEDLALMGCN